MKKLMMSALVVTSTSVFAQTQESRVSVSPLPRSTPDFAQSALRMEPSTDLFSEFAAMHVPRMILAPVAGAQAELSLSQSTSKWGFSSSDAGELKNTRLRQTFSAAFGFGAGFVGLQAIHASGTNESSLSSRSVEVSGFMEPNLTLGARFGSYDSTFLVSVDHSPKIGSKVSEQKSFSRSEDNRRGGSLTVPRLTAIFNLPTAKVGGQLGYAWFGASQRTTITDARPRGSENEEMKVLKASVFSEGAIGAHKIGATLGYSKFDTARISTIAAEAYGAIAVNRSLSVVPALVYATKGTEGDLNDYSFEILSGSVSARANF